MKASIDVVNMAITRKVAILGDMFELGEDEKELHYGVGEYIKDKDIDIVITIGDLAKNIYDGIGTDSRTKAYYFKNKDEFNKEITNILKKGDSILVKASHGMHFETIVEDLKTLKF
jgi:UDP-N-acetylmuramoyl-tripeptide--D-alanyl-D-alanine ligase